MRLAWLTDIHLDFVSDPERQRFVQEIVAAEPDAVAISGDIAVAGTFAKELKQLAAAVDCPVYFVLGNHDYFGGSIADVRNRAAQLAQSTDPVDSQVFWLPAAGPISLVDDTVLIGHGGWGDGRSGRFFESHLVLHDYLKIEELAAQFDASKHKGKLPQALFQKLNQLGDEAADCLRTLLPAALQQAGHVMLLMHVPPFRDACWYNGRLSDDIWAPHFVCEAAGEYLRTEMQQHPDQRLTVLCGHTHGEGTTDILPNLHVITGKAEYGKPAVQRVFDVH